MPIRHVFLIMGHFHGLFFFGYRGQRYLSIQSHLDIYTWFLIPKWGVMGDVICNFMRTSICLFVTFLYL